MFVRIPAAPGSRAVVASRGHFPATVDAAVRQKARWIGGIAMTGWDTLGWRGGFGERWFRMRDRRGPLAAILLLCGYASALLWAEMALVARARRAPRLRPLAPAEVAAGDQFRLAARWRVAMRAAFTAGGLWRGRGSRSIPRTVIANWIAILAAWRALRLHSSRRAAELGQDPSHLSGRVGPAMSHSMRFIGLAVIAWAGVRAVSLGMVPGTQALAFDLPAASASTPPAPLPPVQPTQLPSIPYLASSGTVPAAAGYPVGYPSYGPYGAYPAYAPYPVYVTVPAGPLRERGPAVRQVEYASAADPVPSNAYFEPVAPIEQWSGIANLPVIGGQSTPSFANPPRGFDRIQLSTWAMLRAMPGEAGLAGTGTLGGSQAGARLLWRFNPHLAASLRTSAPVNSRRGGEAALGLRYQPFASIPVAVTAERRKAFGQYGAGRNAFAVFAEGGLYGQSMPWNSSLDTYLQAGIVGAKSRDWFVDGQAAVTRPVWRNLSAGVGVWGGAQPGLSRLDIGPRVSMRVGSRMRVHFDYRHKLVGNAEPGSGAVATIAGDF